VVQLVRKQPEPASKKEPMERLHIEAEQAHTRPVPVVRRRPERVERRLVLVARRRPERVRLHSFAEQEHTRAERLHSFAVGHMRLELERMRHKMIQHRKRQALVRKREPEQCNQHHRLELELHRPVLEERMRALEHMQELVDCRQAVGWEPSKPQRAGGQRGLVVGCRTGRLGPADHDEEEARI